MFMTKRTNLKEKYKEPMWFSNKKINKPNIK